MSGSVAETVTVGESASLYCTTAPSSGASFVTSATPWIAKSASLRSKKTLPTASTLSRALAVATFATDTTCEPSFGVLAASTCGYVKPPSADMLIFTFAAEIGGRSVPATSQVTVSGAWPSTVPPAPCDVTRNGPVPGCERDGRVRALDPAAGRMAVTRGEPEVHAGPDRRRRQELRVAVDLRLRHVRPARRWARRDRRARAVAGGRVRVVDQDLRQIGERPRRVGRDVVLPGRVDCFGS